MLRSAFVLLLIFTLFQSTPIFGQKFSHRASPFDQIRWVNSEPEVLISGVWYSPLAIEDVEVEKIIAICHQKWPGKLQKRFAEDLMEAMSLLGHEVGNSVSLRLIQIEDGKEVILEGIPNTHSKRQKLMMDRYNQPTPLLPPSLWMTKKQVQQDVDHFAKALRDQFAYLELKGIDLDQAIKEKIDPLLSKASDQKVLNIELAILLHEILMRFGDGHSDIWTGYKKIDGLDLGPFTPFLLSDSKDGVIAYLPDRSGIVDKDHPVVVSIDGRPIEEVIAEVAIMTPDGSPQLKRRRALGLLRSVIHMSNETPGGVEPKGLSDPFDLVVRSVDGKSTNTIKVIPSDRKPTYQDWPRSRSRLLEENLGYLRLARMNSEAVVEIHRWMNRFKETNGLIVDVRGNGGGSREALITLAGYLIGEEDPPWVGNFAAYRKSAKFDDDHLANRFMRRLSSDEWTPEQRAAITQSFASFRPEWDLPTGFSEWHALILDRTGHTMEFPYSKPVVILSDAGCFSATDIFLGALEMLPQVTLMGTASSGGSARSVKFTLPASKIEVKCASMASFRPNGKLYDGNGIEVDIEIKPDPTYFIHGGNDRVLDRAIDHLLKSSK